jgi:hypothetical protein
MRLIHYCYLFILGNILISCKQNTFDIPIINSKLSFEICSIDTNNTYQLYIPSHFKNCTEFPIVFLIDPHGSGEEAIKRFIEAGDKYKCVVVASNLIRNNYPDYINAFEILKTEVKNKFQLNGPIFIAGFSGGARMAISYAESHSVDGLLTFGAFGTKDQLKAIHIPIYSLLGMADFNFPEVAEYILSPENAQSNLYVEISDIKHEWPTSSEIERALGFLFFNKPYNYSCFTSKNMINDYIIEATKLADTLLNKKEFIKSQEILKNLMHLPGKNKKIHLKFDSIINSNAYLIEIRQLRQSLIFEMKVRDAYYNSILSKDQKWWLNEINALDKQILNENDKYMSFAFRRIKSYLGILCYSLSRNYLESNDLISTSKVLVVYKLIEPKNPDMLFYNALYEYKSGNIEAAIRLLHNAFNEGFTDKILLNEKFPITISEKVFTK